MVIVMTEVVVTVRSSNGIGDGGSYGDRCHNQDDGDTKTLVVYGVNGDDGCGDTEIRFLCRFMAELVVNNCYVDCVVVLIMMVIVMMIMVVLMVIVVVVVMVAAERKA